MDGAKAYQALLLYVSQVEEGRIRVKVMIDKIIKSKHFCLKNFGLTALCLLIFSVGGCSGKALKQFVRTGYDIKAVKSVAVLPLRNFTSDNYANEKIRSKISIELLSRGINIIEPGEIITVMQELKIRSVDALRNQDMVSIGRMLNVDAVLTGSVESYGISRGITASYPEVSVHLIMFDAITGNNIWSALHTSGGASFWTRHFGAEGSTLDNVSEKVVKEVFDTLYGK